MFRPGTASVIFDDSNIIRWAPLGNMLQNGEHPKEITRFES